MKLKYKLPNIAKLNFNFNVDKLKESLHELESNFVGVMPANGQLCSNNHELVSNVYDHFDQINLTTYENLKELSLEECKMLNSKYSVKDRIRKQEVDPGLVEDNYNIPTDYYKKSYFFEVVNSFKGEAIRVRLTKLNPGKTLVPHIDYDPSYAVRVIVPIITNRNCINVFWRKNDRYEYFLEADGSAYFLNTGVRHSVENRGDTPRIALMFSIKGYSDIEHLIAE